MKKIVVMPVKNEAWILPHTLQVLSLFADHIIVADQQSTDGSRDILQSFAKVTLIENTAEYHSSNVRKLLLAAARNIPGSNAIFSFDADELPTAAIVSPEFQKILETAKPGTAFAFEWIQLWRSTRHYRQDASVWTNNWKHFGFIDDRQTQYETLNVINDHTYRIPAQCVANTVRIPAVKVLHYQFVDFPRMLAKQRLYRLTEFIQRSGNPLRKSLGINAHYADAKNEHGLKRAALPQDWTRGYEKLYHFMDTPAQETASWYVTNALRLMRSNKPSDLQWLDIWDTSWEGIPDPRTVAAKIYHASYLWWHYVVQVLKTIIKKSLKG